MQFLKRLTPRHWAWAHFKVSLGLVWATLMLMYPPLGVAGALQQPLISIWMTSTIIGTITSLTGFVMTAQTGKIQLYGISIELIGLILFVAGPLIYFSTQVYLAFTDNLEERIALCAFAYSMCTVLLYRFIVIVPRFLREAHDPSKEI